MPAQPYGALVHIQPRNTDPDRTSTDPDYNPDPALVRYLNAGPVDYPFHPHSNNERQVGFDAQPADQHHQCTPHPPMPRVDRYSHRRATRRDHRDRIRLGGPGRTGTRPSTRSTSVAPTASPSPTSRPAPRGSSGPARPTSASTRTCRTGITQYNQCGEMYQVAHSHALFQATNYGASMGGMLTMIRIDPPNSFAEHAQLHDGELT